MDARLGDLEGPSTMAAAAAEPPPCPSPATSTSTTTSTTATSTPSSQAVALGESAWQALGALAPSRKAKELWQLGRTWTQRAQDLMLEGEAGEVEPSSQQLARHVSRALRTQHEINKVAIGLGGVNYAVNMVNAAANRQLQARVQASSVQVHSLEAAVLDQSSTIDRLNESISELQEETELHKSNADRLRESLRANTTLLHTSLSQLNEDRERQGRIIAEHQLVIARLQSRKLRVDSMVDLAIAAISAYGANAWLVDWPLRLALSLVPNKRLRRWLRQFSRATIFLLLFRWLRHLLQQLGVHNGIGSSMRYAKYGLDTLRWLLAKALHTDARKQSSFRAPTPTPPATPRPYRNLSVMVATPSQWSAD